MGKDDTRNPITAKESLEILKKGSTRFENNFARNRNLKQEVEDTAGGQKPFAVILSCLDSRVSAELIFDQGIGDIFNFRAAGNFVDGDLKENNNILGSLEFAVVASGVNLILVLGHTGCGAIAAATAVPPFEGDCKPLTTMVGRLRSNLTTTDKTKATIENVNNTIENILLHSECIRDLVNDEKVDIQIQGGIYDISKGSVWFFNDEEPPV